MPENMQSIHILKIVHRNLGSETPKTHIHSPIKRRLLISWVTKHWDTTLIEISRIVHHHQILGNIVDGNVWSISLCSSRMHSVHVCMYPFSRHACIQCLYTYINMYTSIHTSIHHRWGPFLFAFLLLFINLSKTKNPFGVFAVTRKNFNLSLGLGLAQRSFSPCKIRVCRRKDLSPSFSLLKGLGSTQGRVIFLLILRLEARAFFKQGFLGFQGEKKIE